MLSFSPERVWSARVHLLEARGTCIELWHIASLGCGHRWSHAGKIPSPAPLDISLRYLPKNALRVQLSELQVDYLKTS